MTGNQIVALHRVAVLLFLGGSIAFAQSSGSPATLRNADGRSGAISASSSAAQQTGHRAEVVYSQGKLEVNANNSSLNQILRDIALQTGMKITGGVADERVYGRYGPAAPVKILESLLDGTGINMLLMTTASDAPPELILTPRQGGATPPEPASVIARTQPVPQAAISEGSSNAPTVDPAAKAVTNESPPPNGIPTPQQVFEHMQQLKAQQRAQQRSPQ
jgi:hypothetical protein